MRQRQSNGADHGTSTLEPSSGGMLARQPQPPVAHFGTHGRMPEQLMTETNPVRQKVRFRDRQHRSLDEHITARFPAIARYTAARVARMPPSSRLRQRFLARAVSRSFAATKRGDLGFLLAAFYDPDVEWHGTIGGLDEGSPRRGNQAGVRGVAGYYAGWGRRGP